MKKVFIEGGTIVNSKESFVGNILIEDEKIKKVLKPDEFIELDDDIHILTFMLQVP